jgi:integrase
MSVGKDVGKGPCIPAWDSNMAQLNPALVDRARRGQAKPGRYSDSGGLILNVTKNGAASWLLRYQRNGRRVDMGLGPLSVVGLAAARDIAMSHRAAIRTDNVDPLAARRARFETERKAEAEAAAKQVRAENTFQVFAEQFIAARILPVDRKRAVQWLGSLRTYAFPTIGLVSVAEVGRAQVLEILSPIWATKHETARRIRQRIERILDAAHAAELRDQPNPARSRDLRAALEMPRPAAVHHAALPWRQVPAFLKALRAEEGLAAKAFEFMILCATRTNETLGARWSEIDGRTWTIPAARMKTRRLHRVPLAPPAMAILKQVRELRRSDLIFEGAHNGRPLSNMACLMLLRRMGTSGITGHGFRSSFRDWCADNGKPRELAEAALAHIVHGVEGAYFRSDLFAQRRALMEEWARYCNGRR